jgi:polygalacturonase
MVTIFLFAAAFQFADKIPAQDNKIYINIRDHGVDGKNVDTDTRRVQSIIDSASQAGGGTIYFPGGRYLLRTIVLKSNITILLDRGATLLASTGMNELKPEYGSFKDSSGRKFGAALFFAREAANISIEGNGIIDGQGFQKYYPVDKSIARPSIIRFINCKKVKVSGVTLINSAAWVQHYLLCQDVTLRDMTVYSYANKNNDGLDIESCQRVYVTGCNINSEDDSIVLKTLTRTPCKDIVISDCIISGLKSAIKTGTESIGDFENITIANCTIYGTRGISILAVDGGNVNNITVSNISMRDTYGVIVMRLGERLRPYAVVESEQPKTAGTFKNIMISNVQAINVTESNDFISGIEGYKIANITLNNIRIEYAGGGKKSDSERIVPELIDQYPKARMFGTLPSYGFYIRHADQVSLKNLYLNFQETDLRSVLKMKDVSHIEINGLIAASDSLAAPFFWVSNSSDVVIQNCRPLQTTGTFLRVDKSKKIRLAGNEISKAKNRLIVDKSSKPEISEINNY